jgi:hypothetical protein
MPIDQAALEKLRALPPEKQQEVLDFVEFLEQKSARKRPRRSLEGLCADLGVHVTEEDIVEARREMGGTSQREGQAGRFAGCT